MMKIDALEGQTFRSNVVCLPEKNWMIKKGDQVQVEYYFFENAYRFVCRTVEEKSGFEWLRCGRSKWGEEISMHDIYSDHELGKIRKIL